VTVRHGVFLRSDAWPEEPAAQQVVRARAEQVANPEGVISHQSAALILGIPSPGFERWTEFRASITLPSGHASKAGSAVHHVGPLPRSQVVAESDGYRVTSLARTAVDLAADLDLPQALVLLDGAARQICASFETDPRRRTYVNPTYIRAALDLLTDSASTVRASRARFAISLTQPCRESAAESLSAGYMHLAGIPRPSFQAEIRTARGRYFPDFLWEEQRLLGECDGAIKYTDPTAYVAEKEREQDLRDNNWRFVRWLPKEVMLHPAQVMGRIERALGL
jgi:very-short-patch-repair endonuclease